MSLPFDPSTIEHFIAAFSVDRTQVYHFTGYNCPPSEADLEQLRAEIENDPDLKIDKPYVLEVVEDEDIKEQLFDTLMENLHTMTEQKMN